MPKNVTISVSNDGVLTDPPPLIYSVTPAPLNDGQIVNVWPDSSPLLNDALKAGAAIFKKNVAGGWPVVRLSLSDFFQLTASIPATGPWTVFVVAKLTASAEFVGLGGTYAGDTTAFPRVWDGGNQMFLQYGALYGGFASPSGAFHVFTGTTAPSIFVDGVAQSVGAGAGCPLTNFDVIGRNPGKANNVAADVAEILIVQGVDLTVSQRQNAEKTLAAKYSTPAPPAGTVIDLSTLPSVKGWWKADAMQTPFNANNVVGLQSRWETDSISQADGPLATPWQDQSGNNRHATTIIAPRFIPNVVPHDSVLYFATAANAHLTFPPIDITAGWTLFCVCYWSGNIRVLMQNNGAPFPEGIDIDAGGLYLSDVGVRWYGTVAPNKWTILTCVSDRGAAFHYKFFQDGVQIPLTSGGGWGGAAPQFDLIGIRGDGSPCNEAQMKAILCYRGVLSDDDRIYVQNGLRAKYLI
jgi:hypothetical protein